VKHLIWESGKATGFELSTGEVVRAAHLVLAVDPPALANLLLQDPPVGGKACITVHFASPDPITDGKFLVLNGSGAGIVNEVAPISNVAPGLAPDGQHLFSATILGPSAKTDTEIEAQVRKELNDWFPKAQPSNWRTLRVDRIRFAQTAQEPGFYGARPPAYDTEHGVWICSEVIENSSIEGAIQAGRRVAEGLLKNT
jgi:phytoene dehydrogenase-like protein